MKLKCIEVLEGYENRFTLGKEYNMVGPFITSDSKNTEFFWEKVGHKVYVVPFVEGNCVFKLVKEIK